MGCQGSKITEEAYAFSPSTTTATSSSTSTSSSSSSNTRKKKQSLESMVLEDDPISGSGSCCGGTASDIRIEEKGIECKAIESDRDRIKKRQQKAFEKHIRRESSVDRGKLDRKRVRSWNMTGDVY